MGKFNALRFLGHEIYKRSCSMCAAPACIDVGREFLCVECAAELGEIPGNTPVCLLGTQLNLPVGDFSPLDVPPVTGMCSDCGHTSGWATVANQYGLSPQAKCCCCGSIRRLQEWPTILNRLEVPDKDSYIKYDWEESRKTGWPVRWSESHSAPARSSRVWQDDEDEKSLY